MEENFYEAFEKYILDQKVFGWGFQHEKKGVLPNEYSVYPSGYFTEYENGYKMISSGVTLH